MDKTPRERRAAELHRMEIDQLITEYERVLNLGESRKPLHPLIREVLMRAILDWEFPNGQPLAPRD